MKARFLLCLTVCLFHAGMALACSLAPAQFRTHHTQLVQRTDSIVLAKAIGAADEAPQYVGKETNLAQFETLEVLKGTAPTTFTIANGFFRAEADIGAQDFEGHTDLDFWERSRTRQGNTPSCQMRPVFLKDRTYLLFLGTPHWRAYEEIVEPDDLWLRAVRDLVRDPNLQSGLILSPEEWFAHSNGVFLGRLESCLRESLRVQTVFLGTFGRSWPEPEKVKQRKRAAADCVVGQQYVVVTFKEGSGHSAWGRQRPITFEVKNGSIDLSSRHRGEVGFETPILSIEDLKGLFAD